MWHVGCTIAMDICSLPRFSHVPHPVSRWSLTVRQVAANLIFPAPNHAGATQQNSPVKSALPTIIRWTVPVIRVPDFAMPVASPRTTIDSDHTGAGTRA